MEAENDSETYSFQDFYDSIEKDMFDMMKKSYKSPTESEDQWSAFFAAVNWKESFILALIAFHVCIYTTFIVTRKNMDAQTVLFLFIFAVVYFSERINTYGNEHWKDFASQNYFDKSGVFFGIFLSAPLVVLAVLQLVNVLSTTASTLITVKRAELRRRLKAERESAGGTSTPADHGSSVAQQRSDKTD